MEREYILCVDDEAIILASIQCELEVGLANSLDVVTAISGREALELISELDAEGSTLALLITDQRMPGMDGTDLMAEVRRTHPDAPAIMLTGYADVGSIKDAVNDGGLFRLMTKPWSASDLLVACRSALESRANKLLNRSLLTQIETVNRTLGSLIEHIIDSSDPRTYECVRKVSSFAAIIGFEAGLDRRLVHKLFVFAGLHDLGKIAVPREILAKPGPLTEQELALMRSHVAVGAQIARAMEVDPILHDIIAYHHERWDGSGYPHGTASEAIPVAARVVAIADSFDAILAERSYKRAVPFDEAVRIVVAGRETLFDPTLIGAFERAICDLRVVHEGTSAGHLLSKIGIPSA